MESRMRVYITGLSTTRIENIKYSTLCGFYPNILCAYDHDPKGSNSELFELTQQRSLSKSFMLDSGTFSLHQKGDMNTPVERCLEYCQFIKDVNELGGRIDFYFNFDIVFHGENSYRINKDFYELMKGEGLNPVYVIHDIDTRTEVDFVLKENPYLVGISSALIRDASKFQKVIAITDELYNAGIKVHLLGCTSRKKLMATKAWSCDSSSYARWGKINRVNFTSEYEVDKNGNPKEVRLCFHSHTGKGVAIPEYYYENLDRREEYERILEPLGMTCDEVSGSTENMFKANAYCMYMLEKEVTDYHKSIGVKFDTW